MIQPKDLSIIIPLAPQETTWISLLKDLKALPPQIEIIFVGPPSLKNKIRLKKLKYVVSPIGRARQLNSGAHQATRKYLWFVHADSRLSPRAFRSLQMSLKQKPKALHYFNLRFLDDGPPIMIINTIGCWIRSHLMGAPFGDQGFCISKKIFFKLGGFPEEVAYGEDHLFVWRARQAGISLSCTGEPIHTSARKYRDEGWLKTTLGYAKAWTRQAFPEWMKLILNTQ